MNKIISFILYCFLICISNISHSQTWNGNPNCGVTLLALSPTDTNYSNTCNNGCGGNSCNHCKTYALYNGSNCFINNFCVKSTGANTPCFSICGTPGEGQPCDQGCNNTNPKCFGGCTGGLGLAPGGTAYLTVCWFSLNSTESFQFYWPDDGGSCHACKHGVGDTNYWTDTF